MKSWLKTLASMQAANEAVVVVTVAAKRGSAPREAGTHMLVSAREVVGTIGGGHLEFKAIAIARDMLLSSRDATLQQFLLGASLGQCCGGVVNLLFESVTADDGWVKALFDCERAGVAAVMVTATKQRGGFGKLVVTANTVVGSLEDAMLEQVAVEKACSFFASSSMATIMRVGDIDCVFERSVDHGFNIVLFGAGHVGRALVTIFAGLPCRVTWIDSREEEFPQAVNGDIEIVVSDTPHREVANAKPGSYFLVMTHDHAMDQMISEQILRRSDFAYFGLIGSKSKRRQFENRLTARGVSGESLARMTCPIGEGAIRSKEPMAIAVSVAAELLARHEEIGRGSIAPSTAKVA